MFCILQGLLYAKSQLRKLSGGNELSSYSERSKDVDDAFSDASSSTMGTQSTDELSEVLSQADIWLRRAELLQSLLGYGIAASLDDIADKESSARLRDRLILEERYSMAVYTCKKCKVCMVHRSFAIRIFNFFYLMVMVMSGSLEIDAFAVWNAWGLALIRMEHYAQARVKFKYVKLIFTLLVSSQWLCNTKPFSNF